MSSEAYAQKAEQYLKLSDKSPMDAYALIAKEDFVQASEKLRGAAAEIVKAIAARRGIVIKSHAELYKFVSKLGTELEDPELVRLFSLASTLHQNFYEDWLPPETLMDHAEAVKELVLELKRVL
nr:hypothetical protein [uncultured archaeon]CBH36643.1 hypothetical protein, archaeal PaREP1/PaREP8 family [uncultured archaeon]